MAGVRVHGHRSALTWLEERLRGVVSIFRAKESELFGADLRSLAIYRIGLGGLLLVDLAVRAQDLVAHYTDAGVLPRSALLGRFANPWHVSIHVVSGTLFGQALLFLTAALWAVALLVGYRTTVATVVSWALLISLHNRNPMVLQGGDTFLRLLVWWGMFVPLGARYSLDSVLNVSSQKRPRHRATPDASRCEATLGGGPRRIAPASGWAGCRPPGPTPARAGAGTRGGITGATPLLSFESKKGGGAPPERIVSLGTIALFLQVVMVYWFAVIHKSAGTEWWEGSAVYYALNIDQFATPLGQSLLGVPWLLPALTHTVFWFEAIGPLLLFSPVCTGPVRLAAVLGFWGMQLGFRMCLRLGLFPWISAVAMLPFVPPWWWNRVLAWGPLARLGHRLSERLIVTCRLLRWRLTPRPIVLRSSGWANALAACALVYVFFWNLGTVSTSTVSLPEPAKRIGILFRLDQKWEMFAPFPLKDDGWYVMPGTLRDRTRIDLFQGGRPVRWEKPARVSAMYKDQRWRKYLMNIWQKQHSAHRLYYSRYLCRQWNATHHGNQQLDTLEIVFMREETLLNNQAAEPTRIVLWSHQCVGSAGSHEPLDQQHPH